jgi:hypothetical protein
MYDMDDETKRQLFGEALVDELKAIREGISALPIRMEFNELKADVEELKSDVKVIKAAVTDHSRTIHDHERRISGLEQQAA